MATQSSNRSVCKHCRCSLTDVTERQGTIRNSMRAGAHSAPMMLSAPGILRRGQMKQYALSMDDGTVQVR